MPLLKVSGDGALVALGVELEVAHATEHLVPHFDGAALGAPPRPAGAVVALLGLDSLGDGLEDDLDPQLDPGVEHVVALEEERQPVLDDALKHLAEDAHHFARLGRGLHANEHGGDVEDDGERGLHDVVDRGVVLLPVEPARHRRRRPPIGSGERRGIRVVLDQGEEGEEAAVSDLAVSGGDAGHDLRQQVRPVLRVLLLRHVVDDVEERAAGGW